MGLSKQQEYGAIGMSALGCFLVMSFVIRVHLQTIFCQWTRL